MNKRQYKKEYLICKDDFGNNIYAGDTVEIFTPMTFKKPWTSVVYYDRLHGAMIKDKKIFIDDKEEYSHLYHFLYQKEFKISYVGEEELRTYKPYCKKIKSFFKG